MTGFGRFENQNGDHTCKVEIRSVNTRFLEISTRLPKTLSNLELQLKKLIKSRCARGSFDVSIVLTRTEENSGDLEIKPNLPLASQYFQAFNQIKEQLGLKGDIDINSLLPLKDMVKVEPAAVDPAREALVVKTVDEALSVLIAMREEEGENLQTDILSRIASIEKHAELIKSLQPQMTVEYKNKLKEKIQTLTDGIEVDEARIAQEAAIMADRSDVSEEITRLESHFQQFNGFVASGDPIGRKLEFIVQEIHRETNTIGSKTIDSRVSQSVIEIKSELEKIREQLQNVE
ncbi:MAG: YicC/YloC family endoribonuclease [Nitrospinaceae bacterium]